MINERRLRPGLLAHNRVQGFSWRLRRDFQQVWRAYSHLTRLSDRLSLPTRLHHSLCPCKLSHGAQRVNVNRGPFTCKKPGVSILCAQEARDFCPFSWRAFNIFLDFHAQAIIPFWARHTLPLWERSEVGGNTLIPTFSR